MSGDECEYDSTWEDGDENKTHRKKMFHSHERSRRNMFAARDMQNFRHSCRGLDNIRYDDGGQGGKFYNLQFYSGKIPSSPDDLYITDFHSKCFGQYEWLEEVHSYIQWLFPIQEPGVNCRAHVLTKKEIKLFRKDDVAKQRLVKSYKLMLNFYGMRLVDESTGELERAGNWYERFDNLNRHTHNNLRITRILKCLGTLGLERYQAPLVKFFLTETLVNRQLQNVKQSALDYFMFTVLNKSERRELVKFAFNHFKPKEHFVWGPRKFLSGQMAHCKNEKMDRPTENFSSSAEDQQNRHESKHKIDKIDPSRPPKEMTITTELQINKITARCYKPTEANSENEGVGKKKPQELSAGVCDSDVDEKDKLTGTNNDLCSNKNTQCSSENGATAVQNSESGDDGALGDGALGDGVLGDGDGAVGDGVLGDGPVGDGPVGDGPVGDGSVGDGPVGDGAVGDGAVGDGVLGDGVLGDGVLGDGAVGDGVSVSDDNENKAANKSHDGDSQQTIKGCSSQENDVEMKDEEKEVEDNPEILNPPENKLEASNSCEGMDNETDEQDKNEPLTLNILSGVNSVSISDVNENTAPTNNDALGVSNQTEAGPSSQGNDIEMKDDSENN